MKILTFVVIMCFCRNVVGQDRNCDTIRYRQIDFSAPCADDRLYPEILLPDSGIIKIDFDSKTICEITKPDLQGLVTSGYNEIKSDFQKKGVSIFVAIRRDQYKYRFDLSYPGAFAMQYRQKTPFFKESHQIEEGNGIRHVYHNKWITINRINYISSICASENEKFSRVGMAFIKGFNWIIDYKGRKVYLQKNDMPISSDDYVKCYQAKIANDKLIITSRNSRFTKFSVGDEITAVNKVKVNAANICEIAVLLSETDNWNSLDISVSALKK